MVPVAVKLYKIPRMAKIRIVHNHALYIHHLHKEPEGRSVADAHGVVILEYTVGIIAVGAGFRHHEQRAAVKRQVLGHPIVNGKLLFVVGHAVRYYIIEHVLCKVKRFFFLVGKARGASGLIRIGYRRSVLYDILIANGDIVFLRNVSVAVLFVYKALYIVDI